MPEQVDRRFDVKVEFSVKEGGSDFFDTEVKYSDVPYEGVVAIEKLLVELLQQLTYFGEAKVDALGLREKFNQLKEKLPKQ